MRGRAEVTIAVLAALVLSQRTALACESDSDCKGARVCESRRCVAPSTPKKKPAAADSPSSRHPWAYEGETLAGWVLTTRLAGAYGQTLRGDDRQYYGLAAHFAAGLTDESGVYVGLQYAKHFGDTTQVDEALYSGERLTGEVKYDSYNAGIEAGVDHTWSASSPVVVRMTGGLGWSTYYAKGYFNPTAYTPRTDLENTEVYLYLDLRAVFMLKLSESWHLDAEARWLFVPAAEGALFEAGTIAYGLGLGRRF